MSCVSNTFRITSFSPVSLCYYGESPLIMLKERHSQLNNHLVHKALVSGAEPLH